MVNTVPLMDDFVDFENFKVMNEGQKQLYYEKILSDLIQYIDANKILIRERQQMEEENKKLFDISVSSFPANKNEEYEEALKKKDEEMRKKD